MSHHGRVVSVILEFEDKHVERMTPTQAKNHLSSETVIVATIAPVVSSSLEDIPSTTHPYYAVFYDDERQKVHVTKPRRTWSESRDDALAWAESHGHNARRFEIMRWYARLPALIAEQYGSVRERMRVKWHIIE